MGLAFVGESFTHVFYFEHGASGTGQGPEDRAALETADMLALPAGTIVEDAYVVIETAITGATAINIGDDDDADGYVPTASLTLGTPGVYGAGEDQKGALLGSSESKRVSLYTAAGKEAKFAVTGTSTAGKGYVVLKGVRPGA